MPASGLCQKTDQIPYSHFSSSRAVSTRSRGTEVSFLFLRNTLGSRADRLLTSVYFTGAFSKSLDTIFTRKSLQFCLNSSLSLLAPEFFTCSTKARSVAKPTFTLLTSTWLSCASSSTLRSFRVLVALIITLGLHCT